SVRCRGPDDYTLAILAEWSGSRRVAVTSLRLIVRDGREGAERHRLQRDARVEDPGFFRRHTIPMLQVTPQHLRTYPPLAEAHPTPRAPLESVQRGHASRDRLIDLARCDLFAAAQHGGRLDQPRKRSGWGVHLVEHPGKGPTLPDRASQRPRLPVVHLRTDHPPVVRDRQIGRAHVRPPVT